MTKVLILGVAPVQEDAITKLKKLNIETHAIAMENDGPGAKSADYFKKINIIEQDKVEKYIIDNEIDVVYSIGSDIAMPEVSKISHNLDLPHFVSYSTAYNCNHKEQMRKITKGLIGSVDFKEINDENEKFQLNYPLFVKPTDSQGQRGISFVENESTLKSAIKKAISYSREKKAIIEKYVDGYEISVNGYMVDNVLEFCIISERVTWNEYPGLIHKHRIIDQTQFPQKKIKKVLNEFATKLSINNGPIYAQMKVENGEPYIIEITPRLDGCHMHKVIKYSTGIDLLRITLNHLIYKKIPKFEYNNIKNVTLEFICEHPNQKIDYSKLPKINEYLEKYYYYNQNDLIRSVNGVYDKVGYYIYNG